MRVILQISQYLFGAAVIAVGLYFVGFHQEIVEFYNTKYGSPDSRPIIAKLSSLMGDVKYKAPRTLVYKEGRFGGGLRMQDTITTDTKSSVNIVFNNGLELKLGENSLLVLEEDQSSSTGDLTINFLRGKLKVVSASKNTAQKVSLVKQSRTGTFKKDLNKIIEEKEKERKDKKKLEDLIEARLLGQYQNWNKIYLKTNLDTVLPVEVEESFKKINLDSNKAKISKFQKLPKEKFQQILSRSIPEPAQNELKTFAIDDTIGKILLEKNVPASQFSPYRTTNLNIDEINQAIKLGLPASEVRKFDGIDVSLEDMKKASDFNLTGSQRDLARKLKIDSLLAKLALSNGIQLENFKDFSGFGFNLNEIKFANKNQLNADTMKLVKALKLNQKSFEDIQKVKLSRTETNKVKKLLIDVKEAKIIKSQNIDFQAFANFKKSGLSAAELKQAQKFNLAFELTLKLKAYQIPFDSYALYLNGALTNTEKSFITKVKMPRENFLKLKARGFSLKVLRKFQTENFISGRFLKNLEFDSVSQAKLKTYRSKGLSFEEFKNLSPKALVDKEMQELKKTDVALEKTIQAKAANIAVEKFLAFETNQLINVFNNKPGTRLSENQINLAKVSSLKPKDLQTLESYPLNLPKSKIQADLSGDSLQALLEKVNSNTESEFDFDTESGLSSNIGSVEQSNFDNQLNPTEKLIDQLQKNKIPETELSVSDQLIINPKYKVPFRQPIVIANKPSQLFKDLKAEKDLNAINEKLKKSDKENLSDKIKLSPEEKRQAEALKVQKLKELENTRIRQRQIERRVKKEILPDSYISQTIRKQRPFLNRCYAQHLRINPNAEGRIDFNFKISPKGQVEEIRVLNSSIKDVRLLQCTMSVIERAKFRAFNGDPIIVNYPITFE
ncbi:MAG: AgmX/PglI C-terminal domain-containing protein [Bdellovibrionales bacterium]